MISVVCPFYNEEAILEASVRLMLKNLESLPDEWELLIVNDGSRDRSLDIAQQLARENSRLRVLSYTPNRGRGYAIRRRQRVPDRVRRLPSGVSDRREAGHPHAARSLLRQAERAVLRVPAHRRRVAERRGGEAAEGGDVVEMASDSVGSPKRGARGSRAARAPRAPLKGRT